MLHTLGLLVPTKLSPNNSPNVPEACWRSPRHCVFPANPCRPENGQVLTRGAPRGGQVNKLEDSTKDPIAAISQQNSAQHGANRPQMVLSGPTTTIMGV